MMRKNRQLPDNIESIDYRETLSGDGKKVRLKPMNRFRNTGVSYVHMHMLWIKRAEEVLNIS